MKPLALALAAALSASPVLAGEWKEGSFRDIPGALFDEGGFKVSNCHLEPSEMGGLKAVPKCYVMNMSGTQGVVRIDFVVLNNAGAPVISATLTPFTLQSGQGTEVSQFVPVTLAEFESTNRVRVRVTKP